MEVILAHLTKLKIICVAVSLTESSSSVILLKTKEGKRGFNKSELTLIIY